MFLPSILVYEQNFTDIWGELASEASTSSMPQVYTLYTPLKISQLAWMM